MKKFVLITMILALFLPISASQILMRTLPNGFTIATQQTADNNVALYIFIKTGSVHEEEYLGHGISHYLEHVVSRGTNVHRTESEYSEIERQIGAIGNAFVGHTMTAFHYNVSAEHVYTAFEMLAEYVTEAGLDPHEVERERSVILAEIVMRSTPPLSRMRQRINEIAESETNWRFPVIGYTHNFEKLTREDLVKYYNRRYVPDNMIFVAVGNLDPHEMMEKAEETFSQLSGPPAKRIVFQQQPVPLATNRVYMETDMELPTVYMSRPMPLDKPADYFAMKMLTELLYGKRNSVFTHFFVEEKQLVNYIWGYYPFYDPNTSFSPHAVQFEPKDIDDIELIIDLYHEKLTELLRPKRITQKMLDDIVNRLEAESLLESKSADDRARDIGFSLARFNLPNGDELVLEEMKKVTVADIHRVIRDHCLKDKQIIYAIPRAQMYRYQQVAQQNVVKSDLSKITINPQTTLIYKYSDEKPIVRVNFSIPTGFAYESEVDLGTYDFMTDILFMGSRKFPSTTLTDWLADRSIRINTRVEREYTIVSFDCLTRDFDALTERIVDMLRNPEFAENNITLAKQRRQAQFQWRANHPGTLHDDFRSRMIYSSPREQKSTAERFQTVHNLTRADLINAHKKYITGEDMYFSVIGDIDENRVRRFTQQIRNAIPTAPINENRVVPVMTVSDEVFVQNYGHEQVNIDINMRAPGYDNMEDLYVVEVINRILSGVVKGRIHVAVRQDNDLAYFAGAHYIKQANMGIFRLYSQCALNKKDELIRVLKNEIEILKTELVSIEEIENSINEYTRALSSYLADEGLVTWALVNELNGLGYDYLHRSVDILKQVTPEDILRVANQYFDKMDVIVSEP
jgi:zinc protease